MIALLALAAAMAAPAEPVCIRLQEPPAGLEAWGRPVEGATRLKPGQAAHVALRDVATLRFAVKPGKVPEPGSYGVVLPLAVKRAGTYRVALSQGAWLDVVRGGKALASTGHMHGPACTGIRKIVEFALTPGRYSVQIEGAKEPSATVLVAGR